MLYTKIHSNNYNKKQSDSNNNKQSDNNNKQSGSNNNNNAVEWWSTSNAFAVFGNKRSVKQIALQQLQQQQQQWGASVSRFLCLLLLYAKRHKWGRPMASRPLWA